MQRKATCLIMATLLEGKPFIEGLSLARTSIKLFPVYRAGNMIAIISGIGKANSAMAVAYACLEFVPRLLINAGAAGATDTSLQLGASLHVSRAIEYDRPQEINARMGTTSEPAPYEHTPDILRGFPLAVIATLDRPTLKASERRKLAKRTQLVDMESAAFIQACRTFGKKCYVFKFVSDTPAHTSESDIVSNIKKHRDGFFDFFLQSALPRF